MGVVVCALVAAAAPARAAAPNATTGARSATSAQTCVPTVQEPPPASVTSPAFKGVLQPAVPSGWTDQDFFVSCSSPAVTYKTAVFVRRPTDATRASGVAAVDPLHSAGIWGMETLLGSYFVSHGDVQVGVAASHDVVERLVKGANPTRYASLDVPATPDATNEILAGVGALLHLRTDPLLAGVAVKRVILGGWSQTSVVTRAFLSSPEAKATAGGRRLFDGYFPAQAAVGTGGGSPLGPIPDVGVPILELQGERELLVTIAIYGRLGYRRADSTTYRLYEVAGMSHINDEPDNPISGFAGSLSCDWPAGAVPSAFRQTDIWAMGFDSLVRWVSSGVAPPHAPRIELEADRRTVRRDTNGNARGGVRSTFVDVPTASIMPTSLAPGGVVANPCAYAGYQLPLGQQRLQQLFGTHAGYVAAVTKDANRLVAERFLLPADAGRLVAAAQGSTILR
jgi:Alpha/beta hydrolase domain